MPLLSRRHAVERAVEVARVPLIGAAAADGETDAIADRRTALCAASSVSDAGNMA